LDEIFDFGNSVMPEHQWIEKMKNIAKSNIFGFVSFRSGLILICEFYFIDKHQNFQRRRKRVITLLFFKQKIDHNKSKPIPNADLVNSLNL